MSQEWGMEVQDILPELDQLDSFLRNSLPGKSVHTMDLIKGVLQGNWVLEPMLIWRYIRSYACDYISDWKKLFISLLALFILSAVVTSFLSAFQNTQAAKTTEFFFLLCQLTILITAIRQVMDIVTGAIEQMTDFLKLAIPAYMICIAAAGSGLSATIFYKLLLSFLCMIEGIVIAGIMPAAEAYMLLGAMESLMGEERFKGVLDLIKKGIIPKERRKIIANLSVLSLFCALRLLCHSALLRMHCGGGALAPVQIQHKHCNQQNDRHGRKDRHSS